MQSSMTKTSDTVDVKAAGLEDFGRPTGYMARQLKRWGKQWDGSQDAIKATGRSVLFLTQWPLRRNATCADVDVAPPVDYANWRNAGF